MVEHLSSYPESTVSVLLVEDDAHSSRALARHMSSCGFEVVVAHSVAEAKRALERNRPPLLIADLSLPDGNGADLIRWALREGHVRAAAGIASDPKCDRLVAAMRSGAQTILCEPIDLAELSRFVEENDVTRHSTDLWMERFAPTLIGETRNLREQIGIAARVAQSDCGVLITGETGTGKEVLARAIHVGSPRSTKPFVAINCAALPAELIESELFGHTSGAFTGADRVRQGRILSAQGGTLFLDEIGDMPLSAQAKLLRVLQEKRVCPVGSDSEIPVDVRVLCATHHSLEERCENAQFRVDLLYRLNVITIDLPPLRERRGDVVLLARHFLRRAAEASGRVVPSLDASAEEALRAHSWPGNVRELKNVVERALLLTRTDTISAAELRLGSRTRRDSSSSNTPITLASKEAVATLMIPPISPSHAAPRPLPTISTADLDLKTALSRKEQELIHVALHKARGNRTEAAALLGLNRTTLVEKLRRLVG